MLNKKTKVVLYVTIFALFFLLITSCKPKQESKLSPEEQTIADLSSTYGNIKIMNVKGSSMEPSFSDGQKVYVATEYYKKNKPQKDDVVAVSFKTVEDPFIKRVAFVEGDSFTQSGNVFALKGSDAKIELNPSSVLYKQLVSYDNTVPSDQIIVLSDNANGFDSRSLGLISIDKLAGKIVK